MGHRQGRARFCVFAASFFCFLSFTPSPQARDQGTPVEGGAVILRRLDDAAYPEPELAADEAWWHDVVTSTDNSDVEWMAAEDPLFILYTSGSAFAASFPFCLIYPRLLDLPFHPRSLRRAAV